MQQKSFKSFPSELLPKVFHYPPSYLMLESGTLPTFHWWFEDVREMLNPIEDLNLYAQMTGHENIIPFAREYDWAACFDGNDPSGNPRVLVFDLGDLEHFVQFPSFDDWLRYELAEYEKMKSSKVD